MKLKSFIKMCVLSVSVLLAACAKHHGVADGTGFTQEGDVSSHGVGEFTRFPGQEPGESYTTQAPHNQRYLFSYDDSTFAPKYMASLNAQSNYLKSHPGARILLAGHADERGSREYNIALGERRANTVAELMRMAGISRNQMRVVSYGK